jgi:polysaccharide export outer membrane protein
MTNLLAHPEAFRRRLAALLAAMALTLMAAQITAQQPTQALGRALPGLQPGDGIRLRFWREPSLNGEYFVDETGAVTVPLVGTITVTGIPADQLKRDLLRDLEAQLVNQTVQINLLTRVRILGAVHRPGLYHVDPTMMLGDAVALAGGATPNGRLDRVRIVRGGEIAIARVNATEPVFVEVRSGDQIVVPERSWISRNSAVVFGAVISAAAMLVAQAAF